ncbi:unnamed protein product, partial [Mesorhabditis belari]|uniref:Uncharacterized protein n=1 Tax=Mesorhabditis belari TaxID=2138241 RepID=A0AAF3JBQ7_9BILA
MNLIPVRLESKDTLLAVENGNLRKRNDVSRLRFVKRDPARDPTKSRSNIDSDLPFKVGKHRIPLDVAGWPISSGKLRAAKPMWKDDARGIADELQLPPLMLLLGGYPHATEFELSSTTCHKGFAAPNADQ